MIYLSMCFLFFSYLSLLGAQIGDAMRVRQILLNYLTNSKKYTKRGFIFVEIKAEEVNEGRPQTRLTASVRDSGIGIPLEQQQRVFSRFVQVDGTSTRVCQQGAGLGLSICKSLATMMRGDTSLESRVGEGSVFTFSVCLDNSTGSELNLCLANDDFDEKYFSTTSPHIVKERLLPKSVEGGANCTVFVLHDQSRSREIIRENLLEFFPEVICSSIASSNNLEGSARWQALVSNMASVLEDYETVMSRTYNTQQRMVTFVIDERVATLDMLSTLNRKRPKLGSSHLERSFYDDLAASTIQLAASSYSRDAIVRHSSIVVSKPIDMLVVANAITLMVRRKWETSNTKRPNMVYKSEDWVPKNVLDVLWLNLEKQTETALPPTDLNRSISSSVPFGDENKTGDSSERFTPFSPVEPNPYVMPGDVVPKPLRFTPRASSATGGSKQKSLTENASFPILTPPPNDDNDSLANGSKMNEVQGWGFHTEVTPSEADGSTLIANHDISTGPPTLLKTTSSPPCETTHSLTPLDAKENGERAAAALPTIPPSTEAENLGTTTIDIPKEGQLSTAPVCAVSPIPYRGRALVVEDNTFNQFVITSLLTQMGFESVVAVNGREGVDQFTDTLSSTVSRLEFPKLPDPSLVTPPPEGFDIILMDCFMPIIDGFDATRMIRDLEQRRSTEAVDLAPHIPIIGVTASTTATDYEKCIEAGMLRVLYKPIRIDALKETLREFVPLHSFPPDPK